MSVTGKPEHGPMRVGIPMADLCAGHFCAQGILAALLARGACVSRLGLGVAKRLLLLADRFSAQQMLDCGFLDRRVAPEAPEAQVEALIATLAGMAPLALLGMKKHLNHIARGTVDAAGFARPVADARPGVPGRMRDTPGPSRLNMG